jgi:hypothetical protein
MAFYLTLQQANRQQGTYNKAPLVIAYSFAGLE